MNRLKQYSSELQVLSRAKPKLRKAILGAVDNNLIRILQEIILNILRGNLQISKTHYNKLKKYKQALRKLTAHKTRSARQTLIQKGGLLPLILPAIIAALGGVAASGVGAAVGGAIAKS